jgi:hypothetical protein
VAYGGSPPPDGSWSRYEFKAVGIAPGDYPVSGITVTGLPEGAIFNRSSGGEGIVRIHDDGFGDLVFHGNGSQTAGTHTVTVTIAGATGSFTMKINP